MKSNSLGSSSFKPQLPREMEPKSFGFESTPSRSDGIPRQKIGYPKCKIPLMVASPLIPSSRGRWSQNPSVSRAHHREAMVPTWDGSCLGSWSQVIICQTLKKNNTIHHQIKMGGKIVIVQTRQSKTPYMCMVDEMKPYFGLPKLGTHWFKYGKLVKIIIKAETKMINLTPIIVSYPTLSEFKRMRSAEKHIQEDFPELADRIRISFAFRVIFGIRRTNKSSLIIKWFYPKMILGLSPISSRWMNMELSGQNGLIWYPVSINESYPNEPDINTHIPDTILDEWFDVKDIADVTREMCLIREYEHVQLFILETQSKIEKIIERVDDRLIGHVTDIIQRLILRLTFNLKPRLTQKIKAPGESLEG